MRGYYAILDATPELSIRGRRRAGSARAKLLPRGPVACSCAPRRPRRARSRPPARALLPLCRAAGVPFCVNDRLDVALAVGADVVHLGQDDLPLADAQRVRAGGRAARTC